MTQLPLAALVARSLGAVTNALGEVDDVEMTASSVVIRGNREAE
jgi:hypothetical protein